MSMVLHLAEGSDIRSAALGVDVSWEVGELGPVRIADQLPNTEFFIPFEYGRERP